MMALSCTARWVAYGWGLVAALAASACAPTAPPPPSPAVPGVPPAPAAAPQPERGGIFQLAARQPVPHLSYWREAGVAASIGLTPVYERLLVLDFQEDEDWREHYRVVPWLAERWEQPDPRTYVFQVRKGIKWHDGADLTARDVEWAYKELLDPKNAFRGGANLKLAETIQAIDESTLRIRVVEQSAIFLVGLADRNSMIQPRHVVERGQKHEDVAIGTGPYKVASFDRQKGLDLVRNDLYWQGGAKPYLDKVKIVWGMDVAGMFAAFQAKQSDVLKVIDKVQFDQVKALSPQVKSRVFLRDLVDSFWMRVDRPPFQDVRVRQAVHLGIDRQQLVNVVTFGLGLANPPEVNGGRRGWVIPQDELKTLPGWRQPKDEDIAEARRLLSQAGYGDGLKIVNRYNLTQSTTPQESEILAQQLKKIGIDMELQPMERVVFEKAFREGDFEVSVESGVGYAPERDWNDRIHSKGAGNGFGINDPELDRPIEAQAVELDEKRRQQLFLEIQRLGLRKMYVIPLISPVNFTLWHPWVHGWIDNYAGQAANQEWSQLWVSREQAPKDRS